MPRTDSLPLTQFELEVLATQPAGHCELIVNEKHFAQVVRDGMAKATISLDIMTADFKAMLIPHAGKRIGRARGKSPNAKSVVDLFRKLAAKGVEIRILHSGTPSGPALQELKKAGKKGELEGGGKLIIRRCPRLHAKAVVIDTRMMYLGSANLTGAGLGAKSPHRRNFEMGIWTTAGPMIEGVLEQFNLLWEGHQCKTCDRRDFCPVPLEEPRL